MTFPTISYFIESITGIYLPLPIQTFGLFIVSAFIIGGYFIQKEFIRLEKIGVFKPIEIKKKDGLVTTIIDYFFNGLMSFLFGYKILFIIQNYTLFSESPQQVLLSSEGNIITGLLFLIITILYLKIAEKKHNVVQEKTILPSKISWNLIFVAGISGIVGAKLFAVFEDINYLLQDPLSALLSFSGLTFYGGLIFGTITVILYAKKYKLSIPDLADTFAPSLILAYGIGRLGCHFSGDGDWGIISNLNNKPSIIPDWLWGYNFPHNVIEAGQRIEGCVGKYCHELPYMVYPTSLYEACFGILMFLFLIKIREHISTPGVLFGIYLIMNGLERFLIEMIRVTEKYIVLGFNVTQAQIIGLLIIVTGITLIIYLKTKTYESIQES